MKSRFLTSATAALTGLTLALSSARAGHVYGGIIDTNGTPALQTGDALAFVNNITGAAITGQSLGIQSMPLATVGSQAGLFLTSTTSFTALGNGLGWSGTAYLAPSAFAAGTGSLLQLQIVGVAGPGGAKFSFWDEAVSLTNPATTYTVGSGITSGTGIWNLTDLGLTVGDGSAPNPTGVNNPPIDPYGHIHGRSFTVDLPGDYTVDYILHDASGLQADSAPFTVSYSVVPEPGIFALLGGAGIVLLLLRRRRSANALRVFLVFTCATATIARAHDHFGAGVLDANHNGQADAGEPLQLVTHPAPSTLFHLMPKATGQRYGGYFSLDEQPRALFSNDYFTFVALSDGHALIEEPGHAANGSEIWMEITSVVGPAGGSFGYWSEDWSYTHTSPTASFLANDPTGGFKFELSEPLPIDPDGDPYGHIHDRGWTADLPGEYTVGFILYDLGTAGPGGGPIHSPSETYYFTFVAVPEPGTLMLLALAVISTLLIWTRQRRRKTRCKYALNPGRRTMNHCGLDRINGIEIP